MKGSFLLPVFLALVLIVSGCASPKTLHFETVEQGANSGILQKEQAVIKTQQEWQALWDRVHSLEEPKPVLPVIDFENEMAVAVFMGQRNTGGYSVEIMEITEEYSGLKVYYKESLSLPGGIVTQALTAPYHIVKLNRTDKPVSFAEQGSGNSSTLQAQVEEVDVQILESFPVQVNAVAKGKFPDNCTSLDEVKKTREGNTFKVEITSKSSGSGCAQTAVSFEQSVAVDANGLSAGTYAVNINGVEETFMLEQDNVLPGGLRTCPDEWIDNRMPVVGEPEFPREYFILDGERMEMEEFDVEWVKENCGIEPMPVY